MIHFFQHIISQYIVIIISAHCFVYGSSIKIYFSNILKMIIYSWWMVCRVGLTSGGWMWRSGVTEPPVTFNEISRKTFLAIRTYVCLYISSFLWPSLTVMLHFLPGPQALCLKIHLIQCDCNYYFFLFDSANCICSLFLFFALQKSPSDGV